MATEHGHWRNRQKTEDDQDHKIGNFTVMMLIRNANPFTLVSKKVSKYLLKQNKKSKCIRV